MHRLRSRHPEVRAKRASKGDGGRAFHSRSEDRARRASSFEAWLRRAPQDDGTNVLPWVRFAHPIGAAAAAKVASGGSSIIAPVRSATRAKPRLAHHASSPSMIA